MNFQIDITYKKAQISTILLWVVLALLVGVSLSACSPAEMSKSETQGRTKGPSDVDVKFTDIPGWTTGNPFEISVAYDTARRITYVMATKGEIELYSISSEGERTLLDTLDFEDRFDKRYMEVSHDSKTLILWDYSIGQVYTYDLEKKDLKRIDRSKIRFYMHGNGSIVMEDGSIMAMGGYGFWRNHNFLLHFKPDLMSWEQVKVRGDIPENSQAGYMVLDPAGWLLYVSRIEYFTDKYQVHSYDLLSNRWNRLTRRKIEVMDHETALELARTSYSYDPKRRLQYIGAGDFFDHERMQFVHFNADILNMFRRFTFYHRIADEQWVLVGIGLNTLDMTVGTVEIPLDESNFTPFEQYALPTSEIGQFLAGRTRIISFSMVALFGLIVALFFGIQRYREVSSPMIFMTMSANGENLKVRYAGKGISLQDPILLKLWNVIYQMTLNGLHERPLNEVDHALFKGIGSFASNTKNRNRAIELINQTLPDSPLIEIHQNPVDKRYKVFKIKLSQFKIVTD